MDTQHNPYANRTRCNGNSSRSTGSFYESLPDFLEPVQRPVEDDILKRLQESRKMDKEMEWRMRVQDGGCDEFDCLRKSWVESTRGFADRERRFGKEIKRNVRGALRHGEQFLESDRLSSLFTGDGTKMSASFTREQCRRRGDLYGPQAIAAVTGQRVTRSSVWESMQYPSYHGIDCNPTTISPLTSSSLWTNSAQRRSGESNVSSRSKRKQVNRYHEKEPDINIKLISKHHRNFAKSDLCCRVDDLMKDMSCESGTVKHDFREKKCTGGVTNMSPQLGSVGKVKPFPLGDQKGKASKRSHVKTSKRRPLRRKQKGATTNQKSVSKHMSADKRQRGPRIQGINTSHPQIPETLKPVIRTVVLPYPKPKYRHTM